MTHNIIIASDSFKDSLSAKEACAAIARGVKRVFPDSRIDIVPMADGGEGTVEALVDATDGEIRKLRVQGPLPNQKVDASYGILGVEDTVVIEMASASGLELVDLNDRNPLITTTYGTGELIKAALDYGAREIVIGIGGSATNDGGAGMAQALGAKLLDKNNNEIKFGGKHLEDIDRIDISQLDKRLENTKIRVACDVSNYLTGEEGASAVFGPQKGATPNMIQTLDKNLRHYSQIIKRDLNKDVDKVEGAGAAGGLGAGLLAFTNASLETGVKIVIDTVGLEPKVKNCDFVFTGEGGMDYQTKYGKTPYGVSMLAKKYKKPVFAIAGTLGKDYEDLYEHGMTSIFSSTLKPSTLQEALDNGAENIEKTAESISRVISEFIN